jgi:hypothetical protein
MKNYFFLLKKKKFLFSNESKCIENSVFNKKKKILQNYFEKYFSIL